MMDFPDASCVRILGVLPSTALVNCKELKLTFAAPPPPLPDWTFVETCDPYDHEEIYDALIIVGLQFDGVNSPARL